MDSEDTVRMPRKNDYVSIIDTSDEWEGLIGKVDEFMSADGSTHPSYVEGDQVILHMPTKTSEIRACRMVGINHFTAYVRYCLNQQENRHILSLKNVEWVNPEDI